jgi:hypothetical protein
MVFSLTKIKKTIERLKSKIRSEVVVLLAVSAVFMFIFYSTFFNFKLDEQEVSDYLKPFENSRSEYKNFINNTSVNIKNLAEDNQIKEMKYHTELITEKEYKKRDDPFTKSK